MKLAENCNLCGIAFTSTNESDEHILLNCIGGRLTSKNIWCRVCNGKFGEKVDAELCRQLNPLANILNIERDRGIPQDIHATTSSGETIGMESGGKPFLIKPDLKEVVENGVVTIDIIAPSRKIVRQMLQGLKRKYPNLDIDALSSGLRVQTEFLEEPVQIRSSVGGDLAFRSITKTAVAFFLSKGRDRGHIEHLLPYLKQEDNKDLVWFFDPGTEVIQPHGNEILHNIVIRGDRDQRLLYAFVEFFSIHKFLVKLNDQYIGDDFFDLYTYDPVSKKVLMRPAQFYLYRGKIKKVFEKNIFPYERVKKDYLRVLTILHRPQTTEGIVESCMSTWMAKHPEGTIITQEMIAELSQDVATACLPLITRASKKRRDEVDRKLFWKKK